MSIRTPQDYKLIAPLLLKTGFFKEQNFAKEKDLHEVISVLKFKEVPANTYEIREGEKGDLFYILLKGQVTVWTPELNENMIDDMHEWLRPKKDSEDSVHFDYVNARG